MPPNSPSLCYSVEYSPKPLLCVLPLGPDQHPYCATCYRHPWEAPGPPRTRSLLQALSPSPDSLFLLRPPWTLLVPYELRKSLWSPNQILPSQRWRGNRMNFVNTEEKPWVIKHTWPYAGADCSIHREAEVPGGKHKIVKKGLWNKFMFYLETGQKVWLNFWSTGMVCFFLWTSEVFVCLWWR